MVEDRRQNVTEEVCDVWPLQAEIVVSPGGGVVAHIAIGAMNFGQALSASCLSTQRRTLCQYRVWGLAALR